MLTEIEKVKIREGIRLGASLQQIAVKQKIRYGDLLEYAETLKVLVSDNNLFLIVRQNDTNFVMFCGTLEELKTMEKVWGPGCRFFCIGVAHPDIVKGLVLSDLRVELGMLHMLPSTIDQMTEF